MKKVVVSVAICTLFVTSCNITFASDLSKGISLRNRHYAICSADATPREAFYVDITGHVITLNANVRYVNSCSPLKHKLHRYRLAVYNYQRFMN